MQGAAASDKLEPCAVKVASTVLRGEGGGNTPLLPGTGGVRALNQSEGGISMGRAPDHAGFTLALV
jgi:hypothetical protein